MGGAHLRAHLRAHLPLSAVLTLCDGWQVGAGGGRLSLGLSWSGLGHLTARWLDSESKQSRVGSRRVDAAGSLRSGPRNRRGITFAILYCSSSRSQSPDLRGQGSRPHPSIGVRVRTWELLLGVRHCAKHSTRCLISFCQSSDSYCSTVASRKRNNLSRATWLESQSKFVYLQTMSSGPTCGVRDMCSQNVAGPTSSHPSDLRTFEALEMIGSSGLVFQVGKLRLQEVLLGLL